jgi:hypothetical protein
VNAEAALIVSGSANTPNLSARAFDANHREIPIEA